MRKRFVRLLSFIPAVVMAAVIFSFSGQEGEESAGLSGMLAGVVYDVFRSFGIFLAENRLEAIELLQYPIRKLAHMGEYAVFTAALHLPVWVYGFRGKCRYALPFVTAAGYAALDELHQRFVPGRAGCVTDVFIDLIGVCGMTIFLWLVFSNGKKCDKIIL